MLTKYLNLVAKIILGDLSQTEDKRNYSVVTHIISGRTDRYAVIQLNLYTQVQINAGVDSVYR